MPRMTTTERTAIATPATGLQVYDTDTKSQWFYNGTIWVEGLNKANGLWKQDTADQISLTFPNGKESFYYTNIGNKVINKLAPTIDKYDASANTITQVSYLGTNNEYNSNFIKTSDIVKDDPTNTWSVSNDLYSLIDNDDIRVNETTIGMRSSIDIHSSNSKNQNSVRPIFGVANHSGTGTISTIFGVVGSTYLNYTAKSNSLIGVGGNCYVSSSSPVFNVTGVQSFNQIKASQTGLVSSINGIFSQNVLDANTTANITNVYGFRVFNSFNATYSGTITNLYDFYSNNNGTIAGTITNKYGFYILGADKKNYLEGKLGVGTNNPTEKLEVAGAIKIGTTTTATPAAGTIRFNSTTNKFEGYDGTAWVAFH